MTSKAPGELRLRIANRLSELAGVGREADAFLEQHGADPRTRSVLSLALEEVLSNVIRHGFDDGADHELSVRLRATVDGFEFDLVDDGRAFDPASAPNVDVHSPLEQRRAGGLGIHLLRSMVRDVRYHRTDERNHLRVKI